MVADCLPQEADSVMEMSVQDVFLGHGLGITPKGSWREGEEAGLGP